MKLSYLKELVDEFNKRFNCTESGFYWIYLKSSDLKEILTEYGLDVNSITFNNYGFGLILDNNIHVQVYDGNGVGEYEYYKYPGIMFIYEYSVLYNTKYYLESVKHYKIV